MKPAFEMQYHNLNKINKMCIDLRHLILLVKLIPGMVFTIGYLLSSNAVKTNNEATRNPWWLKLNPDDHFKTFAEGGTNGCQIIQYLVV